jgi:hypothetical protein
LIHYPLHLFRAKESIRFADRSTEKARIKHNDVARSNTRPEKDSLAFILKSVGWIIPPETLQDLGTELIDVLISVI